MVVLAASVLLLAGCDADKREWRVAGDAKASADEIIDAGGPVGVASSGGQTVVAWEVEPEDDEGPYQGAWRLYDKDGDAIADGRFKQVHEQSAVIGVNPLDDGFLIGDYATHTAYRLDRAGTLHRIPKGTNMATLVGDYVEHEFDGESTDWTLQLPNTKRLVRWTELPTDQPQGMIFAGGELWVGLPRTRDYEPGKIAHSATGRAPWTVETIPNPDGTAVDVESLTTSGNHLYAVAVRWGVGENGDRTDVVTILRRSLTPKGRWERIDGMGIDDGKEGGSAATLTVGPRVTELPDGRLFATASGEGAWLQQRDGTWSEIHPPKTHTFLPASVEAHGSRLWSFGAHDLHHSDDGGRTWEEFDR